MFDRRALLGGLSAAAVLPSTSARLSAMAGGGRGPDLSSPEARFRTFIMMRGALDEQLVTSWVSAHYYGVVEDRMDPLFAVVSAVFSRYRAVADEYEAVNFELAWFTDPASGKALDTWRNPYNGAECVVPTGGLPPSAVRFGRDMSFRLAKPVPGLEMEHEVLPFDQRGDDIWVTERSRTAMTFPGSARPFRYSESNTFHARSSDLARPGATRVTSEVSFTNICSWRPWMQMGDRAGHLTAIGIGRQNASMQSIPPAWVEATAARRPEVLKDPAAILEPLWSKRG